MNKPTKTVQVGVNALAREVGLTPTTVSKKLRQGQTPDQIRRDAARKQGRAPAEEEPLQKGPGRPPVGVKQAEYDLAVESRMRLDNIDDAKLRRARALAERSELDNMLRRGELIPVAYVRKWASRYLTEGRDMLMTGPSELQDVLAAESDPLRVAEILRAWLERVMATFHKLDQLWGEGEEKVA